MPFFAQPEEQEFPPVQSDISSGGPGSAQEGEADEQEAHETLGNGATVVALDGDEDDHKNDGNEYIPAGIDIDEEAAHTPVSTKKRGGRSRDTLTAQTETKAAKTPRSTKRAAPAASSGRKRKAADAGIAAEAEAEPEATPAKKRGRPPGTTGPPSARLAAKPANKVTRGRPKGIATATSTKPSRARPTNTATATTSTSKVAKTASKGTAKRGRPKKDAAGTAEGEWEVEKILDSGIDTGSSEHKYFVKWKGYASKDNTWEPRSNLAHCMELVRKFDAQRKSRASNGAEEPGQPKRRGRPPKAKA